VKPTRRFAATDVLTKGRLPKGCKFVRGGSVVCDTSYLGKMPAEPKLKRTKARRARRRRRGK